MGNARDLLGPRESFGAFAPEPAAPPGSSQEPPEPTTANGASASESEPQRAATPADEVVASVAVDEVRALPAALLSGLPGSWALHCTHEGVAFVVTNSRTAYRAARDERVAVFLGGEWFALAHAAQNDRAWARELREWLERKSLAGEWRLTHAGAFGGMPIANAEDLAWNTGDVFDRVGATILRAESCT